MTLDLEGERPRYFHERVAREVALAQPVHQDVSREARERLMREVVGLAHGLGEKGTFVFTRAILEEINRVFGSSFLTTNELIGMPAGMPLDIFLTVLEISAANLTRFRKISADIKALQSILADDRSAYRFRNVGTDGAPVYQIQLIDNEHLHKVITDRTFELTRIAEFKSAQNDYAEAWGHYSKGDLDDALVNAHKAVESACKIIIKRIDPTSTADTMTMNALATELVRLDILPARLQHMATHLGQIFGNAGTLRNAAGTGHGSVDLTTVEASVALLGLRLSGTLIAFLAERWGQMKPAGT